MSKRITFSIPTDDFSTTLRKRVEAYFKDNNIRMTGNLKLYMKTAILMLSICVLYTILVFFTPVWWISLPLCGVLGLNMAAIGFNIMHDGAHGSYSAKTWVNEVMAYTLNLMGASSFFWKLKHNVIHHSFTNVEGHDDDIDIRPFIRTNDQDPKYWFHRYQHVYSFFLYTLTYIWWVFMMDFIKYFNRKIASTPIKNIPVKEHIIFWVTKAAYVGLFLVLPIVTVGLVDTILGYTVAVLILGLVLSVVFQLAHVVEDASFPVPHTETNTLEHEWTVHQLATTANFSTQSKIVSWFTGGLNYQVEHHLFPRISHIHYPQISKIIKDVCTQYDIKYLEYPNVYQALRSHIVHLRNIGR